MATTQFILNMELTSLIDAELLAQMKQMKREAKAELRAHCRGPEVGDTFADMIHMMNLSARVSKIIKSYFYSWGLFL